MATWIRRLVMLLRGQRRFDAELEAELQFHAAMTEARLREDAANDAVARTGPAAGGAAPRGERTRGDGASDAAETAIRIAAQRRVARSPLLLREQARDAWGWSWLDRLQQDVRYAVRLLVRRPGFTIVAIAVLALGLGASLTVFSVVYGVLLRPLPFDRPAGLAYILEGLPRMAQFGRVGVSPPDYLAYAERQRSFEDMGAYSNARYELSGADTEPERIMAVRMSPSLFALLGRRPALGRAFTADEDRHAAPVAIASWGLWQRLFHGDRAALGRTILLDRKPYTLIGVMPREMEFPLRGSVFNGEPADLFVPLAFTADEATKRGSRFNFSVIARLKPGVTFEAARAEAATLAKELEALYPAMLRADPRLALTFSITPLRQELTGEVAPALWILFGAITLVLLVGCADLGGLLLTRAATRAGELNVRAALGAGRGRLIRQLMTESLVLAIAGGLIGLALASGATRLIATYAAEYLPRAQELRLNGAVVAGMLAFSVLAAIAFGLAPALWITQAHGTALANRRTTAGRTERHLLRTLVVVQVTLAIVLAIGAGLLARSLSHLLAVDPGFRGEQTLAAAVSLPTAAHRTRGDVGAFTDRLLTAAHELPGTRSAALATTLPMHLDEQRTFDATPVPGGTRLPPAAVTWVMGSFFRSLDIPLRRGRLFTDGDGTPDAPLVVIINETLAKRVWGTEDPIGRRISWGLKGGTPNTPWMTVIGVVGDVKQVALSSETRPQIYEPLLQNPRSDAPAQRKDDTWDGERTLHVIVRTDAEPEATFAALRRAVQRLDPSLPLANPQRLDAMVSASVTPQRFSTQLLGAFAMAAVLLAALGLYGLLSNIVTQRTREIGVRLALGAQPGDVLRLIVRQGLTLVAVGVVLGLAGATAATQAMKSLLFGVQPFDPLTFAAVAIALAGIGLFASLLPAWRAARVDPVRALRAE